MPDSYTGTPHADGTPERLGRYRLVRPISTGGMARVFEARRESLAGVSPRVAIKIILPDFATDEGFRSLFVNEARIGSMLQHQNLVQIQDFDCEEGLYYLVMEYVEGITLRRVVSLCRRHGIGVPLTVVAEIGRQMCDGLLYAHTAKNEQGDALNLVHRDIKPSNLMINPQGVIKLLDFGISKALISNERKGAVRGTWGYMAPEQAGGEEVGPAADLFGLAAVLYELVALEALFPEKGSDEIRALMAQDEAARRASRLTGPVGPLAGVLVRGLQRDPVARFNSAGAMGRALAALVVDPVSAREQVVHLQNVVSQLARPGGLPVDRRRSASTMNRGRKDSAGDVSSADQARSSMDRSSAAPGSLARPSEQGRSSRGRSSSGQPSSVRSSIGRSSKGRSSEGLPVAVGDHLRPVRPGQRSRSSDASSSTRRVRSGHDLQSLAWWQAAGMGAFLVIAIVVVIYTGWRLVREDGAVGTDVRPPVPAPVVVGPPTPDADEEELEDGVAEGEPATGLTTETAAVQNTASQTQPAASSGTASSAAATQPEKTTAVSTRATQSDDREPSGDPGIVEVVGADPVAVTGTLTVSSIPRAQVIVDGKFVRYSPLFRYEVPSGSHTITLISDDGRRTAFHVDVEGGAELRRVWDFDQGQFVTR